MIKNKVFKQVLHIFLSLLLVFYSFAPGLLYAREATSSAVDTTPSPSPSVSPSPTETSQHSPSPSPEPQVNGESTESAEITSPSPEVTSSPAESAPASNTSDNPVPSPNENQEQANAPPTESSLLSVSPSPSPSTQPTVTGHLSASIIKDETVNSVSLDLDPINTNTSASLTTDKPDYSPTDTVIVSGTDFTPEITYTLKISSSDPPPVDFQTEVTTDGKGSFKYSYQLDGTYRPNYKAEAKDQNGNAVASVSFTDTEVPSDMVSWWKGEDNANDSEGLNHGSLINSTTFAEGKVGRAFSFDGVDDYIEVPHAASLDLTGGLTLETWFKLRSGGRQATLFSNSNSAGNDSVSSYILVIQPDGSILVILWGSHPADYFGTTAAGLVTTDQWYHVAVTWDGTYGPSDNVKLYLNGALVQSWTKSLTPLHVTTQTLTLGSGKPPEQYGPVDGLLDEMKIFNRALSADEISATYNADTEPVCVAPPSEMTSWWPGDGNAQDIQNGNHGTLQGDATFAPGKVDQAFSFDGAEANFVEIPDSSSLNPSGAFSVDGWFYIDPNAAGNAGEFNGLVSKYLHTSGWELAFDDRPGDGFSKAVRFVLEAGGYIEAKLDNAILTPNWYHIAGVFDPAATPQAKLYLNGVHVASSVGTILAVGANNRSVRIGATHWTEDFGLGNDRLNGMADEVEYFNRALTAEEIAAIANADSAGKCKEESTPTGTITIEKVVEGGTVPSSNWSFNILGDQGTVASDLHDGDSVTLPTGTYTISESTIVGYTLTGVSGVCSDINSSNATLTVTEEDGTCTLTNTATDTTPPELTSAETQDTDENGQIDAVELTFTEDIDDNMLDTSSSDGWDVDGYDNEIISTGQTGYDNILLLTFSESGWSDTATTPNISYTSSDDGDLTSTHDLAGNELESGNWATSDGAAPVSSFSSPGEGSFWNDLIEISGSSTDMDILGEGDTVDYVYRYYSLAGEDNWEEIDQISNEGAEPFEWDSSWEPEEEGTYDFKAEATDISGNTEQSPVIRNVVYDITEPESDITYPEEGVNYSQEQWDGKILTEADDALSGIAGMLVSVQRDADNKYWDGADDEDGTGWRSSGEEYLNEATLGEDGSWSFDFSFIEPEGGDEGYTVRSHGVDNAGNREDTTEVHFYFGRPPVISGEAESNVAQTSATINWTTDFRATSRVLYDTVSHLVLGAAPNYGYADSTTEADSDPKVTSHSVLVSGLSAGTTYYYRTVSHGSPEAAGDEKSFKTLVPTPAATTNTTGSGTGDGLSDGLGCGSHDCSGNGISSPSLQVQTLGVSIALAASPQEVLGATAAVEESSDEQVDDQVIEEVKGEQTIGETGEPRERASLFGGIIKNSFGLIILIILIILTYFIYRMRFKRKDQN